MISLDTTKPNLYHTSGHRSQEGESCKHLSAALQDSPVRRHISVAGVGRKDEACQIAALWFAESVAWIFQIISFSLVPNLLAVRWALAQTLRSSRPQMYKPQGSFKLCCLAALVCHVNPNSCTASGRREFCLMMNLKENELFIFLNQGHSALNIALALVLFGDAEVLEGSYFGATVSNSSCISRLWGLKWCMWTSGKLNQYLTSEAQMELCSIRINWMLCYKRVNVYSYRLTHSSLWSTGMFHGPQFCQMGKLRLRPPLEATHSRNSD